MNKPIIRIGGASGYWGDSGMATPQFLNTERLDYIVYDYLAEITMSIMARSRETNSSAGYARDFITVVLKQNLGEIARQGVKIVSNAGGVNPHSCGEAVRTLISEQGLDLSVAVVIGDDLIDTKKQFADKKEMYSEECFPELCKVASINAYLGAFPVAKALDEGADIIITGRTVDSAVTLGACIHEFGWHPNDWNELAGGTLAGHILECGPQATGGNFTDWQLVAETIDTIGYPIAEIATDGSFDVVKPGGTGGIVTVGTVSEQMLYEIGDPQAYIVPDVGCDFSQVSITQSAGNRVNVAGAIGYPATDTYKVSATYRDGWRGGELMTFYGFEADKKAESFADAAFKRARAVLRAAKLGEFSETSVEILGTGTQAGKTDQITNSREVVLKFAAKHVEEAGINALLKEATGLGLATPPGLSGFSGARPKPSPVVRLFSFLIPKNDVAIQLDFGDRVLILQTSTTEAFQADAIIRPEHMTISDNDAEMVDVLLIDLAWGRSGDKGNKANVGSISRKAEYLPYIWSSLGEDVVAGRFSHFLKGGVQRFLMPGPNAINFLLHDVLGGGGVASLRNDPQGKGYAQILLDHPISIPKSMAEELQ